MMLCICTGSRNFFGGNISGEKKPSPSPDFSDRSAWAQLFDDLHGDAREVVLSAYLGRWLHKHGVQIVGAQFA